MIALIGRALWIALCVVAAALVYSEGGAADAPPAVPRANVPPPVAAAPHANVRSIRFFFGGGGVDHRVAGAVHGVARDRIIPLGVPPDALRLEGDDLVVSFLAPGGDLVGFAVVLPPQALGWDFTLDGAPWPDKHVYAGPYGLTAPDLVHGIDATCADHFATGSGTPFLSTDEIGAYVICEDR